jgi:hypothetical protein
MKLYLSAPMSGLKDFNRPAMLAAEAQLKRAGFAVFNPARLPAGKTWEWYMRKAISTVPKCGALAQMPNWETSHGCCIELRVAVKYKLPVRTVSALLSETAAERKRKDMLR